MDFRNRIANNVLRCEGVIGYTFVDKTLCAEALNTAADEMSFYNNGITTRQLPKNDRLAVYGDIVAAAALCSQWYADGREKGVWNLTRNEVLSNDALAERGFTNSLDTCVTRNNGTPSVSRKMMATTVEAILGAVHREGGADALGRVMERLGIVDPLRAVV